MKDQYALVNYFDVVGNKQDGYEINNCCVEETGITITDDATEKDILKYLVQIGFLTTSDRRKVHIDVTDSNTLEIYAVKDNYPIGSLRKFVFD